MRAVRFLAAAALVLGASMVVAPAGAADAVSIDDYGWWTQSNVNPAVGSVLVPDVAVGQLLVEGTPGGATAISALRATLPPDTKDPVLTMRAASSIGADTAVALACQTGSGWTGTHGGAWASKPTTDCSTSAVATISEDGTEWVFDLSALQFGDQINVILVAGVEPNSGSGSSFRVVFDRPQASDIQVSPDVSFDAPVVPPLSPPSDSFSPAGSAGTTSGFTAPAVSPAPTSVTAPPPAPALPEADQGQTATAPVLTGPAPVPVSSPIPGADTDEGRLLGVLLLLCAAAGIYWTTTLPVPAPRALSRFSATAAAAGVGHDVDLNLPAEPVVGGLGRFRRERTTPARRVGS